MTRSTLPIAIPVALARRKVIDRPSGRGHLHKRTTECRRHRRPLSDENTQPPLSRLHVTRESCPSRRADQNRRVVVARGVPAEDIKHVPDGATDPVVGDVNVLTVLVALMHAAQVGLEIACTLFSAKSPPATTTLPKSSAAPCSARGTVVAGSRVTLPVFVSNTRMRWELKSAVPLPGPVITIWLPSVVARQKSLGLNSG